MGSPPSRVLKAGLPGKWWQEGWRRHVRKGLGRAVSLHFPQAPKSAVIAPPSTGGQCRPSMEASPFPASPLHTLQGDGIPLGRELSSCCPCPSPLHVPHLAFSLSGIGTCGAGMDGNSPTRGFFPLSSALGNQSLMKRKCTFNRKRLSSPQTLRIFPPFI